MKDIFATLYETVFGLYDSQFSLVFNSLYEEGGYVMFGLVFIIVPLVLWLLFYFAWHYPYGKFWHWLIWLVITLLVVSSATWGIANNEIFVSETQALNDALADPQSGYLDFAETLPLKYALYNGILTIIIGFIYSLILKQFSKIQIHLPF